jgi:predicted transcriptional regulator
MDKCASGTEIRRRDLLVSVRPVYAEKIVEGAKTVELRRRFTRDALPGAVAVIYSTSPIQALIGCAVVKQVKRLLTTQIWRQYASAACVGRDDFENYFTGVEEGYAILLRDGRRFSRAIGVAALQKRFGFVAPQSFMFLPPEYYSLLGHERI